MRLRFGAAQKCGADHGSARAEHKRGGNAASVTDSSGGNDGDFEVIGEARDKREEADALAFGGGRIERSAMATGFVALGDDGVCAGSLRAARFREREIGRAHV